MGKNKIIGILSMQRIINYGSYMQALGLKLLIESLGNSTVFVDYHIGSKFSKQNIKNLPEYKKLRKILSLIKPIKNNLEVEAIKSQYNVLDLDERFHYRTKVDTLVIGSDEVFNYIQNGQNVGYAPELLGINNNAKKVISYAASCGNLTKNRLLKYNKVKEFSDAINSMSAVSVRDTNTFELVKELTSVTPIYHSDPVLVTDFTEYLQDNVNIENYIIVYGYTNRFTEAEGNAIKSYAKKKKKKLYALGGNQSFCDKLIICKPLEVLSFFRHAYLIITDTFHGTIFSVISKKNFVIIVRPGEEGNENKLTCLINQLGIENKRISNINDIEKIANNFIDYTIIDEYRDIERKRAINYLLSQL